METMQLEQPKPLGETVRRDQGNPLLGGDRAWVDYCHALVDRMFQCCQKCKLCDEGETVKLSVEETQPLIQGSSVRRWN
ncbi:hypothetical protein HHUSO_G12262 [Huso huso]|uniref:Uncharacterized protein n=1 Tax=Huso huso TaxID=61971 RepID=A0ABR0ZJ66_HUSHU